MKWIIVGGDYYSDGGKKSGYINKLFEKMNCLIPGGVLHNGGTVDQLKNILDEELQHYDTIFWFPNVDNSEDKIVKHIKYKFHDKMLIVSKNNITKEYDDYDLITRALKVKANLLLEFTSEDAFGSIMGRVIDPLGNQFGNKSEDINQVAVNLVSRVLELDKFTRVPSIRMATPVEKIPIEQEFIDIIKWYGKVYSLMMKASDGDQRFLGNSSFRCSKGFSSVRSDNYTYVTKRNINKEEIDADGFVPVALSKDNDDVMYWGNAIDKPSVDTPIQLRLYKYYRNISYILHSHCYIANAVMTDEIISCGAIEEFYKIVKMFPNRGINKIMVNLKGHGSIIMVKKLDDLRNIHYIKRPVPEISL